jgi:hypothetical protein
LDDVTPAGISLGGRFLVHGAQLRAFVPAPSGSGQIIG